MYPLADAPPAAAELDSGYAAFALFLLAAAPRFEVGRCERCRRFFWNRWGHANKRTCGRRCSQLRVATRNQRARVQREQREKNTRIWRALRSPERRRLPAAGWKRWVAAWAQVSQVYLSRALKRGDFQLPKFLQSKG